MNGVALITGAASGVRPRLSPSLYSPSSTSRPLQLFSSSLLFISPLPSFLPPTLPPHPSPPSFPLSPVRPLSSPFLSSGIDVRSAKQPSAPSFRPVSAVSSSATWTPTGASTISPAPSRPTMVRTRASSRSPSLSMSRTQAQWKTFTRRRTAHLGGSTMLSIARGRQCSSA